MYLECSPCLAIHFISYEPRGKSYFAGEGESLTSASYLLTGREKYVRAVCVDERGCPAWSQPIFF